MSDEKEYGLAVDPPSSHTSSRQKAHYERIHDDYERHYYDAESMAYRERFIYDVMFSGVDLNGGRVAELACGSGFNSLAMRQRFPDAIFCGFDISRKACEAYRQNVGSDAFEIDLTRGYTGTEKFDAAVIFGGLHHCVADLPATLRTVAAMVKPGGWFLMFEPNSRCLLEGARKFWYRLDPYFDAESEAALDHDALAGMAKDNFICQGVTYSGGPAYFLVYNSLVFRFPQALKRYISPPLMGAEAVANHLPGRFWAACFIARWQRL